MSLPPICLALLAAALLPGSPAQPHPLPGPHAILAAHKDLFAAIDRGDAEASRTFAAADSKDPARAVTMFLADAAGAPRRAEGARAAGELLARLAGESTSAGGTWSTAITGKHLDCYAPELSYAVLEFDRTHVAGGKTEVARFRSTSLLRYEGERWKLFHWHVSPAEAGVTAATAR